MSRSSTISSRSSMLRSTPPKKGPSGTGSGHLLPSADGRLFSKASIRTAARCRIPQIDKWSWMKNTWPVEAQAVRGRHYWADSLVQNFDVYLVPPAGNDPHLKGAELAWSHRWAVWLCTQHRSSLFDQMLNALTSACRKVTNLRWMDLHPRSCWPTVSILDRSPESGKTGNTSEFYGLWTWPRRYPLAFGTAKRLQYV
jgi:hypothetical protein